MLVCVYVYVCVCVCVRLCVCKCVCACAYVCAYERERASLYTCTCVCVAIQGCDPPVRQLWLERGDHGLDRRRLSGPHGRILGAPLHPLQRRHAHLRQLALEGL